MIDGYSEEFLGSFMEHLRRSHPSTRVSAKVVYNEYIANKDHVHMNSTRCRSTAVGSNWVNNIGL